MTNVTPPAPTPTKPNKAILAFVLSFLGALLAQLSDYTEFGDLTPLQWLIALVTAIVVAGGVYAVPNPAKGTRTRF